MNHRGTEAQRKNRQARLFVSSRHSLIFYLSLCLCASVVSLSCGSKPTDLRTLAPADALVYLETNDLATALQPIVDSKPFAEAVTSKPDLSALKGVQVAVVVRGVQASEEKLTDEQSVGKIQPKFVVIADTHAWNFQAVGFAEKKLSSFAGQFFDEVKGGRSPKYSDIGGTYFVWSDPSSAKYAYALVIDSLIYFSNDEALIDKCLAVRRGEADNIAKGGKVGPTDNGTLASGYVSTSGIDQIADLLAVKIAVASDQDADVRGYIGTKLPGMIRSSAKDLTWTSVRSGSAIEDRFVVSKPEQVTEAGDGTLSIEKIVDLFFENIEETSIDDIARAFVADNSRTNATNRLHHREDRFTSTTAERRIVTDFGFIGWLIAQLNDD